MMRALTRIRATMMAFRRLKAGTRGRVVRCQLGARSAPPLCPLGPSSPLRPLPRSKRCREEEVSSPSGRCAVGIPRRARVWLFYTVAPRWRGGYVPAVDGGRDRAVWRLSRRAPIGAYHLAPTAARSALASSRFVTFRPERRSPCGRTRHRLARTPSGPGRSPSMGGHVTPRRGRWLVREPPYGGAVSGAGRLNLLPRLWSLFRGTLLRRWRRPLAAALPSPS